MIMAEHGHNRNEAMRRKNLRTALAVGGLALFFFVLLFVKRLWLS
jgi:hypothetical protein